METTQKTLFDKIWDTHLVAQEKDAPAILYIDLHLVHEVTSPQAFNGLRTRGLQVRRADKTFAVMDHSTPTLPLEAVTLDQQVRIQLEQMERNCREFGIDLYGLDSDQRGIVHVVGPELGYIQPGMTIVCGDSHTSTHGAFGALAFGIGTSVVENVFATQCLLQRKSRNFEVRVEGQLGTGISPKDIILALIAQVGIDGGTGYVLEYKGRAIREMDMDGRMTVCNMSIEAGARAGMIAPDDKTFEYLAGREYSPRGAAWERAVSRWKDLKSDDDAPYERRTYIDASNLEPMISYGTNPSMVIPINYPVPDPAEVPDGAKKAALEKALSYMDLVPGKPLLNRNVEVVFLGSCTNGRISDLRQAASLLEGRTLAKGVSMLVVPGSQGVKRQAEAEGLDRIFKEAGAEWRNSGCSMCIGMNGDQLQPGQVAVSTSNRNFVGRQGKGGRTHLASPLTATAAAITGRITDVRTLL